MSKEIVKYNNDFNLLPMPKLRAIQMDMFMAIISLTREKKENTPFLKHFFDPNKRKIVIPQKTFIELCRLQDSNMDYKEIFFAIDDCLKKLTTFAISYQKNENTIYNFVCFEEADIIADEVHIILQSRFYDMIINHKYGFTAFELAEFIELSGKYTKTLYRLLKQFRSTGKLHMSWDEFLRVMDIPENYRQIDIDTRILKPAIKELTKEQNLFDKQRIPFQNLTYTKEKSAGRGRGGKVTGITFTFKPQIKDPKDELIKELTTENAKLAKENEKNSYFVEAKKAEIYRHLSIDDKYKRYEGWSWRNKEGETLKVSGIAKMTDLKLLVQIKNCDNETLFEKELKDENDLKKYIHYIDIPTKNKIENIDNFIKTRESSIKNNMIEKTFKKV